MGQARTLDDYAIKTRITKACHLPLSTSATLTGTVESHHVSRHRKHFIRALSYSAQIPSPVYLHRPHEIWHRQHCLCLFLKTPPASRSTFSFCTCTILSLFCDPTETRTDSLSLSLSPKATWRFRHRQKPTFLIHGSLKGRSYTSYDL